MMNVLVVAASAQLILSCFLIGLAAAERQCEPDYASCNSADMSASQNQNREEECHVVSESVEQGLSHEFMGLWLFDARTLVFDYCESSTSLTNHQGINLQQKGKSVKGMRSHYERSMQIPRVTVGLYTNASHEIVFRYSEYRGENNLIARGSVAIKSLPSRPCVSDWDMEVGTNCVHFSFSPRITQMRSGDIMFLRLDCDVAGYSSTCAFLVPNRYLDLCKKEISDGPL